jgi:hypothetical protein
MMKCVHVLICMNSVGGGGSGLRIGSHAGGGAHQGLGFRVGEGAHYRIGSPDKGVTPRTSYEFQTAFGHISGGSLIIS